MLHFTGEQGVIFPHPISNVSRKDADYHCSHTAAVAIPAEPENLLPAGKYHTWGAEPG